MRAEPGRAHCFSKITKRSQRRIYVRLRFQLLFNGMSDVMDRPLHNRSQSYTLFAYIGVARPSRERSLTLPLSR